uniref:Uncharacterized protein n=1 Tax=Rhizophora mucronata TaxID=61149 RepID=A0A2P2NTB3_RHIMU
MSQKHVCSRKKMVLGLHLNWGDSSLFNQKTPI